MTLLIARSWDYVVPDGTALDTWNAANGFNNSSVATVDDDEFRTGVMCCHLGSAGLLSYTSPAEQDTLCPHLGFYVDSALADNAVLFNCRHNTGSGFTTHIIIERNSLNGIVVKNGDGTTLATSANSVLTLQNWNFFGIEAKVNDTTGYVNMYLNGAQIINLTGADTQNGGSAFFNDFQIVRDVRQCKIDDFFVFDTNGSTNNTVLTVEAQVDATLPNANGSVRQWTPLNGGDDYVEIDDPVIDDDTTYLETGTVGNQFLVGMGSLPTTRKTVLGMQVGAAVKRTAGGSSQLKLLNNSNGTLGTGSAQVMTSGVYTGLYETYETDPDTMTQWTVSGYNAHEAGAELA